MIQTERSSAIASLAGNRLPSARAKSAAQTTATAGASRLKMFHHNHHGVARRSAPALSRENPQRTLLSRALACISVCVRIVPISGTESESFMPLAFAPAFDSCLRSLQDSIFAQRGFFFHPSSDGWATTPGCIPFSCFLLGDSGAQVATPSSVSGLFECRRYVFSPALRAGAASFLLDATYIVARYIQANPPGRSLLPPAAV